MEYISIFLSPVEPACSPVREGQATTLSCNVNTAGCSSPILLSWDAGDLEVARCAREGCGSPYSGISVNLNSDLSINKVSRTGPFNMEVKWTCEQCNKLRITACNKLEVYGEFKHCTLFRKFLFLCLFHCLVCITCRLKVLPVKRYGSYSCFLRLLCRFYDLNITSVALGFCTAFFLTFRAT